MPDQISEEFQLVIRHLRRRVDELRDKVCDCQVAKLQMAQQLEDALHDVGYASDAWYADVAARVTAAVARACEAVRRNAGPPPPPPSPKSP